MSIRIDRLHPAVKHGAYSATAVLPGESQAEFEKLHRGLVAELIPSGVLEDDIVMTIARRGPINSSPNLRIDQLCRNLVTALGMSAAFWPLASYHPVLVFIFGG
jgi:hypothetical protein